MKTGIKKEATQTYHGFQDFRTVERNRLNNSLIIVKDCSSKVFKEKQYEDKIFFSEDTTSTKGARNSSKNSENFFQSGRGY